MDHGEVIAAFADALRARGIIPDKIIGDGKRHVCDVEGGKSGKGDGRYVLYLDEFPAGGFQNWRDGIGWENWRPQREQRLSSVHRRAYQNRSEQLRKQRVHSEQSDYADAAIKALRIWKECPPALEVNTYLTRKKISVHGVRQGRDALITPVYTSDHKLQSLQFIYPDGQKKFLKGGKMAGGHFMIGEPNGRLCIAEGFATAASIHQATGMACAVVFYAGNIDEACQHLKKLGHKLIFCADDDWKIDGNPGKTKAVEAAQKYNGLLALPEFGPEREDKWTDFNDVAVAYGEAAVAKQIAEALDTNVDVRPEPEPPPRGEIAPSQFGRRQSLDLDLNGAGNAIINVDNAGRVLENDEALKDIVWFDEFLHRMLTGDPAREWQDADDINLCIYMQRQLGLRKMTTAIVAQAVIVHALKHRRNCVRDWLLTLVWDGTPRLDRFFSDRFSAEDSAYTQSVSRNFWLSIAARILKPGCKVDTMVVLEGEQGRGKSKALDAIGGAYFTEQHESVSGKGFFEILQGKFLIEISEMESFNKSEVNKVKQVITCRSDRFREPYSKYAADHPRQCIFVGTTNRTDWNRDETGARRFWPINCGSAELDIAGIIRDREQLFAEAAKCVMAGENWWTMPVSETVEQQEARFDYDIWHDTIANYVEPLPVVTLRQICEHALFIVEGAKRDRAVKIRVAAILTVLGWERRTSRHRHVSPDGQPKDAWQRKRKSNGFEQPAPHADDQIMESVSSDLEPG